ncbi:MAG: PilZ domain-containing protein [Variibacter sp.]
MHYNKRKERRRQIKHAGRIISVDGVLSISCIVLDISESGARIAVENPADVPEEFILSFVDNARVSRLCQQVWRSDHHLGIKFTAAPPPRRNGRQGQRAPRSNQ